MINRKMRNIASVKTTNPKDPLKNKKYEAIIQYMLQHPELQNKQICEKFGHQDTYICKMLAIPEVKERYDYLRKKIAKVQTKNAIWTTQELFQKLQDRLSKTKSDNTFVMGMGTLGKWQGLDKQTVTLQNAPDNSFNVKIEVVKREDKKDA